MGTEKKPFSIKAATYTALISTAFALLSSLAQVVINKKGPALEYEILPISYFNNDSLRITIVNIRIVNDGNDECDDISFAPVFGDSITISSFNFQKSDLTIKINRVFDSTTQKMYYSIPFLNPKEQIVCSFLFNRIIDQNSVDVYLRSKGRNGIKISSPRFEAISMFLFFGTIGMLVLTIGLIVFIIFHQRKVIRFQLKLQRMEIQRFRKFRALVEQRGIKWEDVKEEVRSMPDIPD